jgi:hypothetical protein
MVATTLLGAVVIGALLVADFASDTAGEEPHRPSVTSVVATPAAGSAGYQASPRWSRVG